MRFIRQLVIAMLLFVIMKSFLYPTVIPSESMTPTLLVNDYVFYSKTNDVEVGDIILFKLYGRNAFLTKRVIAIGDKDGVTVEVTHDSVYVNEEKLTDKYSEKQQGLVMPKIILKEGELFVMGDNRGNSADSRAFGPININEVKGKIFLRIPFGMIFKED